MIHSLPASCALSQASFGLSYGGVVETRREGVEDVFLNAPDRWVSRFVVEPALGDMAAWRLLLRQLQGPAGLVYVHDVTNPRPPGGARTAAAFAAMLAAGGAVTWHDATGAEHEWTDAGGAAVYAWDAWPAVPANQTLELRAAAAAGAAEVTIGGLWPSNLRAIAAGDYVQIEHWLYLATADVASDADGVATVAITPTLWRAAPAGAVVRLDCAATIMRLDTRDVVWSRAARERRSPFSLTLREVLPTEGVP